MERRTQRRIELRIPVELTLPGQTQSMRAITRDLSWGGALIQLAQPLPLEIDSLLISLPWSKGKVIRAQAQVLRCEPQREGECLIALRFTSLSPRSQSRLERLLAMLLRQDTKPQQDPIPLFSDLEVVVNDPEELRQILTQLLDGHYTATVFGSYQLGQSIRLSIIPSMDLPDLHLRARVIGVDRLEVKGYSWAELYNLTLVLEHPKRAIREFIELVLKRLSDSESGLSTFSTLAGAPDWLRSVAGALNQTTENTSSVGSDYSDTSSVGSDYSDNLCYLEAQFPQVIVQLTATWGDVEGFDQVFSRLVMDSQALPNGWPKYAWDELQFLQEVHDLAFGLPARRRSLLTGG